VVLGIEVDYLFGCHAEADLTPEQVSAAVDKYYALGVRHIFPVHFDDNGYGGAAFQNNLEKDADGGFDTGRNPVIPSAISFYTEHTEPAPEYDYRTGRRNVRGLTELGKHLIRELIAHGMVVDIDHMRARTKSDTLDICEAVPYPVVAGHVGFVIGQKAYDIGVEGVAHIGMLPDTIAEFQAMGLTAEDLAPMLGSADGYATLWDKAYSMADPTKRTPDGTLLQDEPEPSTWLRAALASMCLTWRPSTPCTTQLTSDRSQPRKRPRSPRCRWTGRCWVG
jgi:hypothetical protein